MPDVLKLEGICVPGSPSPSAVSQDADVQKQVEDLDASIGMQAYFARIFFGLAWGS